MHVPESEPVKQARQDLATPIPPPTWAARRDWRPIAAQPIAEPAASFTDRELVWLKFTKWLVEMGRMGS